MVRSSLVLASAALLLGGCASSARNAEIGPPVVIEVQNNNFQDATVYLFREGERQRLDIVTGKTDQTFSVRWQRLLYLRFEVRFIGGGACATRAIAVEPGQRYVLVLQPDTRLNQDCRPINQP